MDMCTGILWTTHCKPCKIWRFNTLFIPKILSQSHNGHYLILVFTWSCVRHTHILTFFKSPADAAVRAPAASGFQGEAQGQHNGLLGWWEASHRLVRLEGNGQNLLLLDLGFDLWSGYVRRTRDLLRNMFRTCLEHAWIEEPCLHPQNPRKGETRTKIQQGCSWIEVTRKNLQVPTPPHPKQKTYRRRDEIWNARTTI